MIGIVALSGLLWAYMGPLPAPELPVYEAFTWTNGFVEVVTSTVLMVAGAAIDFAS